MAAIRSDRNTSTPVVRSASIPAFRFSIGKGATCLIWTTRIATDVASPPSSTASRAG